MENSRPRKLDGIGSFSNKLMEIKYMTVGPSISGGTVICCSFCGKQVDSFTRLCLCPQAVESRKLSSKVNSHYPDNGGGSGKTFNATIHSGGTTNPIRESVTEMIQKKMQRAVKGKIRVIMDDVLQSILEEVEESLIVVLVPKDDKSFGVRFEWKNDGPNNSTT